MQRKIEGYQEGERVSTQSRDMYNELLIKYNSLLYKFNTSDGGNGDTLDKSRSLGRGDF